MTEVETRALAASGAVVGLCPVTEANLGDGIFPASAYRDAGGRFGVGTDSNVLISASEELRTLEYSQRLRDRRRVRLADAGRSNAEVLFSATLAGGRQVRGPSCREDWVVLDDAEPSLVGVRASTILDRAIFAAPTLPIREVWCGGSRVVAQGRHHARDAVANRFASVMQRLLREV